MIGQLEILEGGMLTSVQDSGRFGYRKYGVPVSGAMDDHSAELANWLVGNRKDHPVIECTLKGPRIKFLNEAIIGMSGARGSIVLNGKEQNINETIKVESGDVLKIGHLSAGCRLYLAIKGDWKLGKVMRSQSTCLQAGFGGFKGRTLNSGDVLSWEREVDDVSQDEIPKKLIPHFSTRQEIRVMPGPEWAWLSENQQVNFLNSEFSISDKNNRMGIRLQSSFSMKVLEKDMKSAPVVPGIIQLPPDGNPIILMKDAQSVGGYPRIAKVAEADVWRIGQLWKGNEINFSLIDRHKSIQLMKYLIDLKKDLLISQ